MILLINNSLKRSNDLKNWVKTKPKYDLKNGLLDIVQKGFQNNCANRFCVKGVFTLTIYDSFQK